MSASKNPDAVINQGGELSSHIAGSEPLEKGGVSPLSLDSTTTSTSFI